MSSTLGLQMKSWVLHSLLLILVVTAFLYSQSLWDKHDVWTLNQPGPHGNFGGSSKELSGFLGLVTFAASLLLGSAISGVCCILKLKRERFAKWTYSRIFKDISLPIALTLTFGYFVWSIYHALEALKECKV
jgi:hypothetical protein